MTTNGKDTFSTQLPKVAVVGTVGLPASYGGFETLVENLVGYQSKVRYLVYCEAQAYESRPRSYKGAELCYVPLSANGWQSVLYDIWCLVHALFRRPNAILILGTSGCCFLPIVRLTSRSRVITNIDGLEWKREKWGLFAKLFLRVSEWFAVTFSDVVISDNESISVYLRSAYGIAPQTIAYGGDHAFLDLKPESQESYAFSVCRIEPENNVHIILSAFSQMQLKLIFVGNWSKSHYGRQLRERFGGCRSITLLDPIYDITELARLRANCNFYVHGHSAGGTNPSLVEMMHFAKPILCFDCVYNRSTTLNKARYFKSELDLRLEIARLEGSIDKTMQQIAEEKYVWKNICAEYEDLFCVN